MIPLVDIDPMMFCWSNEVILFLSPGADSVALYARVGKSRKWYVFLLLRLQTNRKVDSEISPNGAALYQSLRSVACCRWTNGAFIIPKTDILVEGKSIRNDSVWILRRYF